MRNHFVEGLVDPAASVGPQAERAPKASPRSWAKEALFFFYLYCGWVQLRDAVRSLLGRSRVTVLYYHRIGERDVLTRSIDDFRSDIAYLKQNYDCMSLREFSERLTANKPFRRRAAVVTFDDGYRDNFTEAAPVLTQAGVPATFFVATGFIETEREFPHDLRAQRYDSLSDDPESCFPKLRWDDLRTMQSSGFEIGSHTVNHTNLGAADRQTVTLALHDSLTALNEHLGEAPRPFSFPWGKPGDINQFAIDEARRAGYYAAVSAYGGANSRGTDRFRIRRVDVGNGHLTGLAVRARIAGFDPEYFRIKRAGLEN